VVAERGVVHEGPDAGAATKVADAIAAVRPVIAAKNGSRGS